MTLRWFGSLALVLATGCYTQPETEDTDADLSFGSSTGGDMSTSAGPTTSPGGTTSGPMDSGSTSSPVDDSGDSTSAGPQTTGTTTGDDAGTDSTGMGSTGGGLDACAMAPVIADLPGPGASEVCGSSWDVGDVTFQIQNSDHPTCGTGGCSAGLAMGRGGVWVYPAQLYADLTGIMCAPSVVDVTITDYASGAYVTLYDDAGTVIAEDYTNLSGFEETVSLAVPIGATLAGVGAHGCETLVHRVEVH